MISRHGQALWLFLGLCLIFHKLGPSPLRVLNRPHSVRIATTHGELLAGNTTGLGTTIGVLDAETMESVARLEHPQGINVLPLRFSPDGKYLMTVNSPITNGRERYQVHVWDVRLGKEVLVVRSDSNETACFSPDSMRVLVADDYRDRPSSEARHTIGIWNLATGKRLQTLQPQHQAIISTMAWSPDGQYIASATMDSGVRIWEAETAMEVQHHASEGINGIKHVWFSANGQCVIGLSVDQKLLCWKRADGTLMAR